VLITKLRGIGEATAKKLAKGGITTVEQLFVIPPPKVAEMLKVDNDTAIGLFKKARELYDDRKTFISGKEADVEDINIEKISTGTVALDKFFTGGIECGATTEIFGEFGCGKTQFCHTMCVRVQLPKESGGLGGKAIWMDTEGTFEPSRIRSISEHKEIDADEVLDNITVAKAYNSADQYIVLQEIEHLIEDDPDIKLIVIDSAIGLFRQDYSGRAMLSERQKYLDEFLTLASNIANFHNVAIIWTNQVMINPGVFYGDPVTAVGGTVLAHKSTYRVYFKKSGAYRIAKMVDSPKHAQTEVSFGLSVAGVVDKSVVEELEKLRLKEKAKAKKEEKEKLPSTSGEVSEG
jgi:DNA repair protein RadA